MNLVFVGASHFGLRCLDAARNIKGCNIAGVITAEQTFKISYSPSGVRNVLYADIASFASDHNMPFHTITNGMNDDSLIQKVKSWQPDAFLVAGWYHMIPKLFREIAPAYGLHASLLPDYSGGAPLVWAIINGEKNTGITLFQMDDGVDSGPILAQTETIISDEDTIATLYARIEELGIKLIKENIPKLVSGNITLSIQDNTKRRMVPQRKPEDGKIDWNKDNDSIDRFIRAQTKPYPGAFTYLNGQLIHIWKAKKVFNCNSNARPGTIFYLNDLCHVACGQDSIILLEISTNNSFYLDKDINLIINSHDKLELI